MPSSVLTSSAEVSATAGGSQRRGSWVSPGPIRKSLLRPQGSDDEVVHSVWAVGVKTESEHVNRAQVRFQFLADRDAVLEAIGEWGDLICLDLRMPFARVHVEVEVQHTIEE